MSDSLATWWTVATRLLVHGISQARILEWVAISFPPGDLPDPGIESLALAGRFFITEPPEKHHFIITATVFESGQLVSLTVQVTKGQAG